MASTVPKFDLGRGLVFVLGLAVGIAALGAIVGGLLGQLLPGYYFAVFSPYIDPIPTGVGLGLTQGFGAGAVVGLAITGLKWFFEFRLELERIRQSKPGE